jgi:DNA-binding transcriptional regulator WhiA
MAARFTSEQEEKYRNEIVELYVRQNKTIFEIASMLNIAYQTVFQRMKRLGIPTSPELKQQNLKRRSDAIYPSYSEMLAELFGILLGDGHISHFQVTVTLGTKEESYAEYVRFLMESLFQTHARIATRKSGYRIVYLGSTVITQHLFEEGLVSNKVASQVDVPKWIFTDKKFMSAFLRGFFDTDGSVYKLKFGIQISFCNKSLPLLNSLQTMLIELGYRPSAVSVKKAVYLTRRRDIERFFTEIKPANSKHCRRYADIVKQYVRT